MTGRVHESDIMTCRRCRTQIKSWETKCPKCGWKPEKREKKGLFMSKLW